ncbi:class I SAM-dependent methyltransferase [Pseudomonas putida]|uniref:class I SAM-dependent methyltransferase n=1 Tax=Pseudomonas TaxID=286 RepID=UPI003465DCA4
MKNALICLKSDIKFFVKNAAENYFGIEIRRAKPKTTYVGTKVSKSAIKKMIKDKGFAVIDGQASWFYTAYERGDHDPLTNFALDYIVKNFQKDARVLVTGCGTGIMAFHLEDHGFHGVGGFDYLHECVDVANSIAKMGNYKAEFYQADGFAPSFNHEGYDVITAMHWVFSAWMGNYDNEQRHSGITSDELREKLLTEFLAPYAGKLNPGGVIIVELTDAVADYRIASDHPMGDYSPKIYPIRHTPSQVEKCAASVGLKVIQKNLSVSYGHQPRAQYILQRS